MKFPTYLFQEKSYLFLRKSRNYLWIVLLQICPSILTQNCIPWTILLSHWTQPITTNLIQPTSVNMVTSMNMIGTIWMAFLKELQQTSIYSRLTKNSPSSYLEAHLQALDTIFSTGLGIMGAGGNFWGWVLQKSLTSNFMAYHWWEQTSVGLCGMRDQNYAPDGCNLVRSTHLQETTIGNGPGLRNPMPFLTTNMSFNLVWRVYSWGILCLNFITHCS